MSETWRCAKHIVRSSSESWGALCAGRSLIAARRRCAVVVIDIYCGQRVCHQCVTFDDESPTETKCLRIVYAEFWGILNDL